MKTAINSSIRTLLTSSLMIIFSICSTFVLAQETATEKPLDLSSQFKELKSDSESYNDYKVIKTYSLNAFWKEVEDSLKTYRTDIVRANSEISTIRNEIKSLNNQLAEVKTSLEESESRNDGITVFGVLLKKTLYNAIVWTIIAGLLFLTGSMFIAFKNNLSSTKKAKKDYHDLMEEFDIYRKESREKQMKLGRELQTERNKLDEYKDRIGKKEKAH